MQTKQNQLNRVGPRQAALIAGISLLLMALVAGFSFGYVHSSLVAPGDAESTLKNLQASTGLFRAEIFGWAFILILDVIVAWALYLFFKKYSRSLSLLTGWLRVIYAAVLGIAIGQLIAVLPLLDGSLAQAGQQVMQRLSAFDRIWSMGLILFGAHLIVLGYLALRSRYVHFIFGILLLFAGACYCFLNAGRQLLPGYGDQLADLKSMLALPMALGELAFAVWLIVRGGRVGKTL
jgi:hypothetical protein